MGQGARMTIKWVRLLAQAEGQLLELFNDDGEKFGGERVLRVMKDVSGLDVLTVCCRWVSVPVGKHR